jgi:hypothetical protein
MRPSFYLFMLLLLMAAIDACLLGASRLRQEAREHAVAGRQAAVFALGLTDLCVATEARYTRHPAVSDPMAPFMDHPGAIEHFPTGSWWRPLGLLTGP